MDGTIFGKSKINGLIKWYRICAFALFVIFLLKRLFVNYESIYSNVLGLGGTLSSTVLAILFFMFFCLSFIKSIVKKSENMIVFLVVTLICIITSSVVLVQIPKQDIYESNTINDDLSQYFVFDDYISEKSTSNYYYLKRVKVNDSYWCGGSLKKTFEPQNRIEDLTADWGNIDVTLTYYYLSDKSGLKIKEFNIKNNINHMFDPIPAYDNKLKINDFSAYEYDNKYEFIVKNDKEVFYITSNKNDKTNYDFEQFVDYSKQLFSIVKSYE